MSMADSKFEEKIDSVYRITKQMPIVSVLGLLVPIILVIGCVIGLFHWFRRWNLLKAVDSGRVILDQAPPPIPNAIQSGELSSVAKLDFIRNNKHTLLVPLYIAFAIAVLVGGFIALLPFIGP